MTTPTSATSYPIPNWEALKQITTEVNGFIASLDLEKFPAPHIPEFDEKTFSLKSYTTQWLKSKPDPFSGTQDALSRLRDKIIILEKAAHSITERCSTPSSEILNWHSALIGIVQKVDLKARSCLDKFVNYYVSEKADTRANSFLQLSKQIFQKIEKIDIVLAEHFQNNERYTKSIDAIRFAYQAYPILHFRDTNRQHLEEVSWSEEKGVVINEDLIADILADLKAKMHPDATREAIRNVTNFLGVPNEADKIKISFDTQDTFWIPLHPTTNQNGQVEFAPTGVTGTCERDRTKSNKANENICNVYYYVNPHTSQLVISCGVIDTKNKAKQLAACIQKATTENSCHESKRYIIHQFNTFFNEKNLIEQTHLSATEVEELLKEATTENKDNISVLHLNTTFNAGSNIPLETGKSLKLNQKSLLQLAQFTMEDISKLLPEQTISTLDELKSKLQACQLSLDDPKASAIQEEKEIASFVKIEVDTANSENSQIESKSKEPPKETTPRTEEIKPLENDSQTELPDSPRSLKASSAAILINIEASIQELETIKKTNQADPKLDKAILLLKLLKLNLGLQFKSPNVSNFSRCTQIELLLLTYKLLNIHIILICKSGLDRSGGVRTFEIGLSHLEQKFYKEELTHIHEAAHLDSADEFVLLSKDQKDPALLTTEIPFPQAAPPLDTPLPPQEDQPSFPLELSLEDREKAQIRTYHGLFDFICHYEDNRQKLAELFNGILKDNTMKLNQATGWFSKAPQPYLQDLNHLDQVTVDQVEHPRTQLLAKIKGSKELCHALFYEEIVILSLFKESIKTLFSTGIVGLKYHQDAANWLQRVLANEFPMQRWPLFISLNKNASTLIPIQLLHLKTKWKQFLSWQSQIAIGSITKVAQQIILRFAQKRGD